MFRLLVLSVAVAAFSLLGMCNWIAWWYNPEHRGAPTADQLVDQVAAMGVAALQTPEARAPSGTAGIEHAIGLLRQDVDYLERTLRGGSAPAPAKKSGKKR